VALAYPDRDQRLVVAGKDSGVVPVGTLGNTSLAPPPRN
jgi:hypothetical protein